MDNNNIMSGAEEKLSTQTLLQGHVELQRHIKSTALRCASDLGVPSAIHRRGGAATISDLIMDTALHPARLPHLRRLMRVLTATGVFATKLPSTAGEAVYTLTPTSRLLVGDRPSCDMAALLRFTVQPIPVTSFFSLEAWLRDDGAAAGTLFETAHGIGRWDMAEKDAVFNKALNDACVADSRFIMEIVLRKDGDVFCGLSSLVDVGGGHGAAAAAIATAFPHIKCSVLDLPHVVSEAPNVGGVQFIAGSMFDSIPPADAVLFKYAFDIV